METQTFTEKLKARSESDLLTIIQNLTNIQSIFNTYEHKIDMDSHKDDLEMLQYVIDGLWEEAKQGK